MRTSSLLLLMSMLAVFAGPAVADNGLKCGSFGAVCANPSQITAQFTGNITGSLYYTSADFTDFVRVIDTDPNNAWTSPWVLENKLGTQQPSVVFGKALQGDVLVVQLCDAYEQINLCTGNSKNSYLFASDPAYSVDGVSHALVNTLGGANLTAKDPTETWLIWLEDLDAAHNSDWDYNDEVISLQNVLVSFGSTAEPTNAPVPEPASLCLLGSACALGWLRRKKKAGN